MDHVRCPCCADRLIFDQQVPKFPEGLALVCTRCMMALVVWKHHGRLNVSKMKRTAAGVA